MSSSVGVGWLVIHAMMNLVIATTTILMGDLSWGEAWSPKLCRSTQPSAIMQPLQMYFFASEPLFDVLLCFGVNLNLNQCSHRHQASEATLIEREKGLPMVWLL